MSVAAVPVVPGIEQMGRVALPAFLEEPTGHFLYDVMPCVTLLVILPTLLMFVRARLWWDAALAVAVGGLALMFHICQMSQSGIKAVVIFGIDGAMWRTLDIVGAQVHLARTVAHSIGGRATHVATVPNVLLPGILTYSLWRFDSLQMPYVAGITLGCMLLTLGVKLGSEGPGSLPDYSGGVGGRILGAFLAAFACFLAPHLQPALYWFWHSMWHVFLGLGYFELYRHLLGRGRLLAASTKGGQQAAAGKPKQL